MKHQIEKLIWRKVQSLGLGDDDHLNHEQIGELMVEYAKGESRKACDLVLDKIKPHSMTIAESSDLSDLHWYSFYHDFNAEQAEGFDKASLYKYIGMEW